jgi:lipoic acid synthetase
MVAWARPTDEILATMRDMRAHAIDMLTIGQYSAGRRPDNLPVRRYVHPDVFAMFEREALAMGFRHAAVGAARALVVHAGPPGRGSAPAELE